MLPKLVIGGIFGENTSGNLRAATNSMQPDAYRGNVRGKSSYQGKTHFILKLITSWLSSDVYHGRNATGMLLKYVWTRSFGCVQSKALFNYNLVITREDIN